MGSGTVAELQWQRIVDDLVKIGKLKNCLAICDVWKHVWDSSGNVCCSRLLVSELSEEPWKGKLITFSMRPQLQIIKGDSPWSKVESVERMHWNMNTDFQMVFD